LNPDFLDMLSAFSEERVKFLVVGRAASARFGAPIEGLSEQDLVTPGTVFQVGGRTELIRNKKAIGVSMSSRPLKSNRQDACEGGG